MWFDSSSIANLAKNALKEGKERLETLRIINLLRGDFNICNLFFYCSSSKAHR